MRKLITAVIVLTLAFILVVAGGFFVKDSQLQASTENAYEDAPDAEGPVTEVIEIVIDIGEEDSGEETEEDSAELPEEETEETEKTE